MECLVCSVAEEAMAHVADHDGDVLSKRPRYTSDGDVEQDGNYIAGRGKFQHLYDKLCSHIPETGIPTSSDGDAEIVYAVRMLQEEYFAHSMANAISACTGLDENCVTSTTITSEWPTILGFLKQYSTSASRLVHRCVAASEIRKIADTDAVDQEEEEHKAQEDEYEDEDEYDEEEEEDEEDEEDSDDSSYEEDSSSSEQDDSDAYEDED